jgi:G3E family GTPase
VTVVDARNLDKELDDGPEARAQIAFADVILLNKTDLVPTAELARVEARVRGMNSLAEIHRTKNSQIDAGRILNVKARELTAPLTVHKETVPETHSHEHEHGHDHKCDDHCDHDL